MLTALGTASRRDVGGWDGAYARAAQGSRRGRVDEPRGGGGRRRRGHGRARGQRVHQAQGQQAVRVVLAVGPAPLLRGLGVARGQAAVQEVRQGRREGQGRGQVRQARGLHLHEPHRVRRPKRRRVRFRRQSARPRRARQLRAGARLGRVSAPEIRRRAARAQTQRGISERDQRRVRIRRRRRRRRRRDDDVPSKFGIRLR